MYLQSLMSYLCVQRDETQATQIINSVLPQPLPDAQENIQPANYAQKTQDEPSRPELSSSSSQNGGITQYHYFGLASTQTDSQVDGTGIGGGSQKENAHRAGDVPDKSRSNSSVPSHSPDSNKCTAMDAAEVRRLMCRLMCRCRLNMAVWPVRHRIRMVLYLSTLRRVSRPPKSLRSHPPALQFKTMQTHSVRNLCEIQADHAGEDLRHPLPKIRSRAHCRRKRLRSCL